MLPDADVSHAFDQILLPFSEFRTCLLTLAVGARLRECAAIAAQSRAIISCTLRSRERRAADYQATKECENSRPPWEPLRCSLQAVGTVPSEVPALCTGGLRRVRRLSLTPLQLTRCTVSSQDECGS